MRALTPLPSGLLALVVRPPPRVAPGLARRHGLGRQEDGKGALQRVGAPADGVRRVAVVRAPPVEAEVVRRRYEERFEQLALREGVQFGRHVQHPADDRRRSPESDDPEAATSVLRKLPSKAIKI